METAVAEKTDKRVDFLHYSEEGEKVFLVAKKLQEFNPEKENGVKRAGIMGLSSHSRVNVVMQDLEGDVVQEWIHRGLPQVYVTGGSVFDVRAGEGFCLDIRAKRGRIVGLEVDKLQGTYKSTPEYGELVIGEGDVQSRLRFFYNK